MQALYIPRFDFSDNYTVGFSFGINILKCNKTVFSFEITPYIMALNLFRYPINGHSDPVSLAKALMAVHFVYSFLECGPCTTF
jgi:hypothetical protein